MWGGVKRVDLLGSRVAHYLARWPYKSIHAKVFKSPGTVQIYPTLGGRSFSSTAAVGSGQIPTSIGDGKERNPFAAQTEEDAFVNLALTGLGSYPSDNYYMADINRRRPDVLGGVPRLACLDKLSVHNQMDENSILVEARGDRMCNHEHVPGSFSVPFGDNFTTWVGWLVSRGQPLVLLSPESSHHDTMVRLLIHIGCDRVNGYLNGGIDAGETSSLLIGTSDGINLNTLKELSDGTIPPIILYVRQRNEDHAGHIQDPLNIEMGDLQEHFDGFPREIPVVTVCAAGVRASMAGSILQRDGRENTQVLDSGGTQHWIDWGYRRYQGRVGQRLNRQFWYTWRGWTGFNGSHAANFMPTSINDRAMNPPI